MIALFAWLQPEAQIEQMLDVTTIQSQILQY